jgi:hypothetical protein
LGGPFGGGFLLMSFKYLNKDQDIFDGDDGEDVYANEKQLQARLEYFESQLAGLSEGAPTDVFNITTNSSKESKSGFAIIISLINNIVF